MFNIIKLVEGSVWIESFSKKLISLVKLVSFLFC